MQPLPAKKNGQKGMQATILGSGTGVPSLQRNAAGLLVQIEDQNLLFDTGPGILKQLLRTGLSCHDICAIFYTHFHTDHTLDLAAFLFAAKYALSLRSKELKLIGARGLAKFYQGLLELYGEVIRPQAYAVELKEIDQGLFSFEGFQVRAMHMQHTPQSLGYRIEAGTKSLVYSGDTDVCQNLIKLAQRADLLILECSFPDQMKVAGHLTASQAGEVADQSQCGRLLLTHLYPVCQKEEILKQVKTRFKGRVALAEDLMQLQL